VGSGASIIVVAESFFGLEWNDFFFEYFVVVDVFF
jgi:hypothetical protein